MIGPHELKNKTFTKVMRGYSSVEVDEHIDFIIEKYTELYRENDELERKLKEAQAEIAAFKKDEESIRSALINAQKASTKIISEANERADTLLRSSKANCDKILADFRSEIREERDKLVKLREVIMQFKAKMFSQYQSHIEYLEQIAPDYNIDELNISDDVYMKKVVEAVKDDIANSASRPAMPDFDIEEKREPQTAPEAIKPAPASETAADEVPLPSDAALDDTPLTDEAPADAPKADAQAAVIAETPAQEPKPVERPVENFDENDDFEDTRETLTNILKSKPAPVEPEPSDEKRPEPEAQEQPKAAQNAKNDSVTSAIRELNAKFNDSEARQPASKPQTSDTSEYNDNPAPVSKQPSSVRDTIKALNMKFNDQPQQPQSQQSAQKPKDGEAEDGDEEYAEFIKNVAGDKNGAQKNQQAQKFTYKTSEKPDEKKTRKLTASQEFDKVYPDMNKK